MAGEDRIPVYVVVDREWPRPMEDPIIGISRSREQAEEWRQEEIRRELEDAEFESDDEREEFGDDLDRRFFIVELAV